MIFSFQVSIEIPPYSVSSLSSSLEMISLVTSGNLLSKNCHLSSVYNEISLSLLEAVAHRCDSIRSISTLCSIRSACGDEFHVFHIVAVHSRCQSLSELKLLVVERQTHYGGIVKTYPIPSQHTSF